MEFFLVQRASIYPVRGSVQLGVGRPTDVECRSDIKVLRSAIHTPQGTNSTKISGLCLYFHAVKFGNVDYGSHPQSKTL